MYNVYSMASQRPSLYLMFISHINVCVCVCVCVCVLHSPQIDVQSWMGWLERYQVISLQYLLIDVGHNTLVNKFFIMKVYL